MLRPSRKQQSSMRILVTFAVEAEFAPWRKRRDFRKHTNGVAEFFAARIAETEVNVLLTGVGGKNAWLEATKIVWDGDVDVCISSGLAGALRPQYHLGEVLAAREIQAIGWKRAVSSDAKLVRLAEEHGARIVDAFYSADRVISLASEKRELGRVADAVEMESGEVLHEAAAFGARGIAIRGISDAADEDLPLDFNKVMTPTGQVSMSRILGEVVRHPMSTPALMRFGSQSRMAAEKLAGFLDHYVAAVASLSNAILGAAAQ
jgi:adenosylhomocysteine nucleosidase